LNVGTKWTKEAQKYSVGWDYYAELPTWHPKNFKIQIIGVLA